MDVKDFNLRLSVESGQPLTFYSKYKKIGRSEFLTYPTVKGLISIENQILGRSNNVLLKQSTGYTKRAADFEMKKRFQLDQDMEQVYSSINTDPFMNQAIKMMRGMRLTRNDPWETTLCFLISQFNNIKRIRGIINSMITRFGEETDDDVKLFPRPEAIADAKLQEIRACGTGFRDKYVRSVANAWLKNSELENLDRLSYKDSKEEIMKLDGIGDKVADCVLLFGYGQQEAFPIDLWVKRVIEKVYFSGRKKNIKQIHEFAERRWLGYRGYAQQYVFWWGRESGMFS